MTSDAYVMFTCDGESCGANEEVSLPVVFSGYSGKDPHCDLRDESLNESLPSGWTRDGDKHYCEGCSEERTA